MPVGLSTGMITEESLELFTQMNNEEQYLCLFDLICDQLLMKKKQVDEMRKNPSIREVVLAVYFQAREKSKERWPVDFVEMLFKNVRIMGPTPISMEIACNFSEALVRIYEKAGEPEQKKTMKAGYEKAMQKRNEVDPIVTFRNKPIRYSKIAPSDRHLAMDYKKPFERFDASNRSVKQTTETEEKPLDPEVQRLAEKKKERNRKTRENKRNKKKTAKEGVQDNSTNNSEIPVTSLQDTPTSSESPGSSESNISEMVKKLLDFEI